MSTRASTKKADSTRPARPATRRARRRSARSGSAGRDRRQERLGRLAGAAFEGLVFLSERGVEDCNEQMARLLGCRRRELLGRPFLDCVAPGHRQQVADWLAQRRGGRLEFVARRRDGTEFGAEILARSEVLGGQTRQIAAVREITERKRIEEPFTSSQMLRVVLDTLPTRVFWKDRHSVYVGCNRLFAMDYGFEEPNDLIGKTDAETSPAAFAERYHADDREVMATGQGKLGYEEPLMRLDGSQGWLLINKVPLHDLDGRVVGVLGTYEDITERKRTEERLQQLANEQKTILNAITTGICLVKDGKLEWVNPLFASMSGWTEAELNGVNLDVFFANPEDRQRLVREASAELGAGRGYKTEALMRKKDGTQFWCHLSAQAINPQDLAEGAIWVARDVTESKRADEALRASESKLAEIFRVSPELISVSTMREGRYLQVNDAFTRVLGYTREEIIGRRSREVGVWQLGDQRDQVVELIEQIGSVRNIETRIRKKSGEVMDVLLSMSPLNIEGEACLVTVATDITGRKQAEDALRAGEAKLAEIFRTSPSFLSISTLDEGRMLAVNDAAVRMMGYSREEIVGRTSLGIGLWPAREERERLIQMVRERGQIQDVEARMCRKSGEVFDVLTSMTPLNIDGQACLVTGIVDISGLKRAEEAVRQSEVLLRATLDSIEDGVLVVSAAGGVSHCNARFLEIWSIPPEVVAAGDQALLAHAVEQLADPDEFAVRVQEIYRSNVRTRDTLYFKDGRIIERFFSPVGLPGVGVERLWVFRDVTARVRAEAALCDREARLSSIIRAAPVGIGVVDDRVIREVNEAISRMTGYSREELVGQSARVLYPTDEEYLSVGDLYGRVRARGMGTAETRWRRKGGGIVNVVLNAAPLDPEGQGRGITFIAEDVTERIEREDELRHKNEELERFTYTVSHDLKSPLITIKGFAGALLHDAAAGRVNRLEEDLKRIMSATDKMAALLNDLLELSRIGRMMSPPTEVRLDRLVEEVLELLAGPLGQRSVQVIVQPGLPVVQGDRRRLSEVFQNLIENAVRFLGDQPQPQIEIGVRGDGQERVIFVRDNGIGIEPCYHETVFGLFNKLDARTPGTGIGLALVRRIIEVHGGRIWVESAGAGRGATFCFSLPAGVPIWKDAQR